jgi:hypothetical protein
LHTITGRETATVGVLVVVDAGAVVEDPDSDELDVVESFACVVPDDEPGPDDPHAATVRARASPAPAAMLRRQQPRDT